MATYISHSVSETEKIAKNFAATLKNGDIIAFKGGLGVGKTAFTRGIANGLHSTSEITSPTFSLVHEYTADIPIYHFDMYRINTLDDLYSIGYYDYLDMNGIIIIEWSENISDALNEDVICILIEIIDENTRKITINRGI